MFGIIHAFLPAIDLVKGANVFAVLNQEAHSFSVQLVTYDRRSV